MGATFVVWCGVQRYCRRNCCISCLQFFPSISAVFNNFLIGFINFSTTALPWGHSGVIVLHSIPRVFVYLSNSFPLNGGPLSVWIFDGTPYLAKIIYNFGMHVFASVELTTLTSGNFE